MRFDAYITEHSRKTPQNIDLEENKNSISYDGLDKNIDLIDLIVLLLMNFKHCRFSILTESGIQYVKLLMALYRPENIAIPLPIELPKLSLERTLDVAHVNNIYTLLFNYSDSETTY